MRRKVVLIQVVVPSREEIPKYRDLKTEIERLVGEINGRYTDSGWVPIHFMYRHLERDELLAYYRAADVALITPLKDGMNLVAKEYCAAQADGKGVLVLSEFAGAATQLAKGALIVNPNDTANVSAVLREALDMPIAERRRRMEALRVAIRQEDVYCWTENFIAACGPFARKPSAIVLASQYRVEKAV